MKEKLCFQKGDIAAIAMVVFLAAIVFACFLPGINDMAAFVEVYQGGELIERFPLSEDREFTVTGDYVNTVTIRDGKASITHSDCPGGDCMHSGWVGASGRSIVCLPNGVEIRIVSDDAEVDFVVG